MGLESRVKALAESILKQEICDKKELKRVFTALTKATKEENPAHCPPELFIRENFSEIPFPSSLYLSLLKVNAIKSHFDVEGTYIGFTWKPFIRSDTVLPNIKPPKARFRSMRGLLNPKTSELIKFVVEAIKDNKEMIITKLCIIHDKNYIYSERENYEKSNELAWPDKEVLNSFESSEFGLILDVAPIVQPYFPPDTNLIKVKQQLSTIPHTAILEIIHRTFLLELKAFGWKISLNKCFYDSLDSFEHTRNQQVPLTLLKISPV